jgi:SnoaL-like domain
MATSQGLDSEEARLRLNLSIEEIARAFSGHDFNAVYPFLSDDVSWTLVGEEQLTGKADVIATCERTAGYLAGAKTEFRRFRTLVGEDWVVIDSLADYIDCDQETSTVASCDIYDFRDDALVAISSYTIELTGK